jgi:hypothetical protein
VAVNSIRKGAQLNKMTFTEYGISAEAVDCYMHLRTVHNSWLG